MWSLATVEVETGQPDIGIEHLTVVYRGFEELGIVNDAALARMQLAETLLRVGRREEVHDLLRHVVVTFTAEGLMRNAQRAPAYLREAVERDRPDVADVVQHVRTMTKALVAWINSRLSPPTGSPQPQSRLSPPTGTPQPAPTSRLSPPTGQG